MSWLAENCPRLHRAVVARRAEVAEESRIDLEIAQNRLRLQRRVAHRELQLVRSYSTRDARYIAERQKKLLEAERALASFERAAASTVRSRRRTA